MGPRADLDALGVGKNLLPLLGIKPQFCRYPVRSLLLPSRNVQGQLYLDSAEDGKPKEGQDI